MRDHANLSPKFWTGSTGRKMRGKPHVQILALYLMSCPQSNMIGLYYLPAPMLAYETGLTQPQVDEALTWLQSEGVAFYDSTAELVWVPNMVWFQVGPAKPKDKRILGIQNALKSAPVHRFTDAFYDKYGTIYGLERKGHASPLEAPSKPLARGSESGISPSEAFTGSGTVAGTGAVRAREPAPSPFGYTQALDAVNAARATVGLAMHLGREEQTALIAYADTVAKTHPEDPAARVTAAHAAWIAAADDYVRSRKFPMGLWLKNPEGDLVARKPRRVPVQTYDTTAELPVIPESEREKFRVANAKRRQEEAERIEKERTDMALVKAMHVAAVAKEVSP